MAALKLNKIVLLSIVVGGLAIILAVGLLSGLVARPRKCVKLVTSSPSDAPSSSTTSTPTSASTASTASTTTISPDNLFRLPTYLKPVNYQILLRAYFEPKVPANAAQSNDDRFIGDIKIRFNTEQATNQIIFHIDRALNITSQISLTNYQTNQSYTIRSGSYIPNQLYRLETDVELPVGEYVMGILYAGRFLPPATNGLYKTTYLEEGIRKYERRFLTIFDFPNYLFLISNC